jgi:hypothetical protein
VLFLFEKSVKKENKEGQIIQKLLEFKESLHLRFLFGQLVYQRFYAILY